MDESTADNSRQTFLNAEMLEPQTFEIAGGTAAVFSMRRPEKTTPNEDAAAVIPVSSDAAVLIVADGCGGMSNGEDAARIAIECLSTRIAAAVGDGQGLRTAVLDGIEAANREILDLKSGAGATLAVVQLEAGEARPYHVGDSQVLLVGGRGKVKLLTTSHSPVGYAVEAGMLEEHEALGHEERHLVSNFLGAEQMHVEMGSGRQLAERDGLLVASDGVLDNLLMDELVALLRTGPAATVASNIAALALERMSAPADGMPHKPDDLTLIVFTRRPNGRRAPRRISSAPA
jgi:serine/threonine protein phosphatase PrpC